MKYHSVVNKCSKEFAKVSLLVLLNYDWFQGVSPYDCTEKSIVWIDSTRINFVNSDVYLFGVTFYR